MTFLSAEDSKTLKDFMNEADDNLVIFVGAGISHSEPAKLPSWNEMVQSLLLRAKRQNPDKPDEIKTIENILNVDGDINTYLSGIERLKKLLGEEIFVRAIQNMLDCDGKEHPRILYDLLLCNPRGVITTNLDTLIENVYADALHNQDLKGKQEIILPNDYNSAAQLMSKRQWLWKIHGTIANPDTWVMTISEYYKGVYSQRYIDSLINVFQNARILFVGYSARDIDLLYMLEKLNDRFGTRARAHVLLVKDISGFNIAQYAARNIDIIEYGGDNTHANLGEIVAEIKKKRLA